MEFFVFLGLALIGLWTVCRWTWQGLQRAWWATFRRWIYPRLLARHEKACDAFNKTWRGKLVRHAPTGRVGLCWHVCIKNRRGVRDYFLPRWTADVILAPAVARALTEPVNSGFGAVFVWVPTLAPGVQERIPLSEMTIAPEQDAAAFRREMEGSELP